MTGVWAARPVVRSPPCVVSRAELRARSAEQDVAASCRLCGRVGGRRARRGVLPRPCPGARRSRADPAGTRHIVSATRTGGAARSLRRREPTRAGEGDSRDSRRAAGRTRSRATIRSSARRNHPFPISLNSTSKHIKMLERAGLVRREVMGRDHVLSLNAAPLAGAAAWINHYRSFWDDRLAALEIFVTEKRSIPKGRKQT